MTGLLNFYTFTLLNLLKGKQQYFILHILTAYARLRKIQTSLEYKNVLTPFKNYVFSISTSSTCSQSVYVFYFHSKSYILNYNICTGKSMNFGFKKQFISVVLTKSNCLFKINIQLRTKQFSSLHSTCKLQLNEERESKVTTFFQEHDCHLCLEQIHNYKKVITLFLVIVILQFLIIIYVRFDILRANNHHVILQNQSLCNYILCMYLPSLLVLSLIHIFTS